MVIRKQVKQIIDSLAEGVVVTASDFDVPRQYRATLIKALNQFEYAGVLKKVSKGRYYKPRQSVFGELKPAENEIVKDLLVKEGKTVGYVTGTRAFAGLALTTQISADIMVGTNVSRRPITRANSRITFLLQPNPIVQKDIPLLVLLDALRMIKQIPATTPDDSIRQIQTWIENYSDKERARLRKLAMAYKPYVRAQLGAIFDNLGIEAENLLESLNPVSRYKLGITAAALPSALKWNIV